MDWNQIEGNWDIVKGKARQKWAKFTDQDLSMIKGKKDELIGRIKHVYGTVQEEAEKQTEEFRRSLRDDQKDQTH